MIYINKIINFYRNSYKLKIEEKVLQLIRIEEKVLQLIRLKILEN